MYQHICASMKNEFFFTLRIFGQTRSDLKNDHRAKKTLSGDIYITLSKIVITF